MTEYAVVVIGGGPAGLAAAIKAWDSGAESVLVLERDTVLGGILNQCIHNGFGLTRFKESLTGPEYAWRFIEEVKKRGIEVWTDTTVLSIDKEKRVFAINSERGVFSIYAKSIILAMGCRERSKGALNIAGSRPSGLFSAGTAQKYVNVKGWLPGREVVILGSGDIGLIMARRMTLEGAKVRAVCEIMPYSSGLKRNIVQCLDDFDIPLYLSHTIVEIEGRDRVSGVVIAKVDENRKPIKGTEKRFSCDTVLFSVGLIPENELTAQAGIKLSSQTKGAVVDQNRETEIEGVFACGNVLHVHDLVDFVSEEAEIAGKSAADYANGVRGEKDCVECVAGESVGYVLPQLIDRKGGENVKLYFRVRKPIRDGEIRLESGGVTIFSKRKKIFTPGEMESIIIKKEDLAKFDSKSVLSVIGG
ncbi:MAG: FAD-dependent oxidoreductase [Clostridia bacterium]|nr:FAD-dependent oxidoreductase [Clostridia bacterium]